MAGYAPEKIQYGIDRYRNETRRLYGVLDKQLSKSTSGYIVGDRITVADIACWGWVAAGCECSLFFKTIYGCRPSDGGLTQEQDWAGVPVHEFPHLNAWVDKVLSRPAVEKGRHVPSPHKVLEYRQKTEEEMDAAAAETRRWVQQGMQEDAKK